MSSSAQVARVAPPTKPRESFLQWLARITGISATSSGLKGDRTELVGDLWIARIGQSGGQRLTFEGAYSWPVFSRDDQAIIAVRAGELWSVPVGGGDPAKLSHSPSGLVGVVGTGPDGIVVFTEVEIGLFVSDSASFTPFAPANKEDKDAIARMRLPIRIYGNDLSVAQLGSSIVIEKNGKKTDIEIDGEQVGEPSVSHKRMQIVYVRIRK
jgi:hypothetical protein